jgi:hypothetical protein
MRRLLASTLLTGLAVLGAAGTAAASDEPQQPNADQVMFAIIEAIDGSQGPGLHGQVSHNQQHSHQEQQDQNSGQPSSQHQIKESVNEQHVEGGMARLG